MTGATGFIGGRLAARLASAGWEVRCLVRDGAGARARALEREGIDRVIHLGGLGDRPQSQHLRSRHETALVLREAGPPLTCFCAGIVVGSRSESYHTMRYLVHRLPAMMHQPGLRTRPSRSRSMTPWAT